MPNADLINRFTYHSPRGDQMSRYEAIRALALYYSETLDEICPNSREKSIAITKLEEVVFWANASIARHPDDPKGELK